MPRAFLLLVVELAVVVVVTAVVGLADHHPPPAGIYWYEFTPDCHLHTRIITSLSCAQALGQDNVDDYVPRYVRDGVVETLPANNSLYSADPVLASSPDTTDREWASCTVYSATTLPLYIFVRISTLLSQNGTLVVGLSERAPSTWCA